MNRRPMTRWPLVVSRVSPKMAWAALIAYSSLIFWLSGRAIRIQGGIDVQGLDKVVHYLAYGLWASICLGALSLSFPRWSWGARCALAVLLATLYGLSDEWHQSFVPEREADVKDLAADALGAVAAVSLWSWWVPRRKKVGKSSE